METIEKSIEVEAPLHTVYNQWTQFEEFPRFMEGVTEVRQLDDKRLHWKAEIGGTTKEWNAEIFEQVPDHRVAWRSTRGVKNSGMVNFHPVSETTTRVTLKLNYDPEGPVEAMGDALGFVSRQIEGNLERFKEFIEARGRETGGWRGSIRGREIKPAGSPRGANRMGPATREPRSKRLHSSTL